jgi:xanthine dehydrogenase accessory factor
MALIVILRGGGDLASGVAIRLHRCGLKVIITELPQPLVVRRLVSFAEAVYAGQVTIEGIVAQKAQNPEQAKQILQSDQIPVLVDAQAKIISDHQSLLPHYPGVLVDGRMTKHPPEISMDAAPLIIGLGPGFNAGVNCHAVIETNRGHRLGHVIWHGPPEADTGIPEGVLNHREERVLRAPATGVLDAYVEIGSHLESGQLVARVGGEPVYAPFRGVLRGLIHPGISIDKGLKIGDVDPRNDPHYCKLVSDKALAIGGGVLEAILSQAELRAKLWN